MSDSNKPRRRERRSWVRNRQEPASTTEDRPISALLVDISEGGLGVETPVKFEDGDIVELHAALLRAELGLRIDGRARVTHSRVVEPGLYHLGLAFVKVSHTRLSVTAEPPGNDTGDKEEAATTVDFGVVQLSKAPHIAPHDRTNRPSPA